MIFHHISKSAGTSMVHLLQRNYPDGRLLELYDRRDQRAPDPTPQAYAAYLASLDPEQWSRVRCVSGHSVNFAIPVLNEPFRVFTIVRDPVDRVISLYHYLKNRNGFGERGGLAGQLIRSRGWSIIDIFENYADATPQEKGEHQLFAGFFNGQARTVLAPHYPVDHIRMSEGQPDAPPGLTDTLDLVLSSHYLLGSAARYEASVARFAAEFHWSERTVMRDNVTKDRLALADLPRKLAETIRSFNAIDDELHQRALGELEEFADPSPPPPPRTSSRQLKALSEKLKRREDALAEAEQVRGALAAKVEEQALELTALREAHELELTRLRSELAALENALAEERADHARLRTASAARDRGMQVLVDELEERKQALAQAHQANRELQARSSALQAELDTRGAQLEADLAARGAELEAKLAQLGSDLEDERTERHRLREIVGERDQQLRDLVADHERELSRASEALARLEDAMERERTEHHRLRGASAERDRQMQRVADKLQEREQALARASQLGHELEAAAEQRDRELAELRGLLAKLSGAGRQLASELGLPAGPSREDVPERDVALVEAILERAQAALASAAESRRELTEQLEAQGKEVRASGERERELESELELARAEEERYREAVRWLMDERRRMVGHARGLVASRAWRYGHGASRVLRRLAFRPSKKRGAADVLLAILEAPPQLPPGDQGKITP